MTYTGTLTDTTLAAHVRGIPAPAVLRVFRSPVFGEGADTPQVFYKALRTGELNGQWALHEVNVIASGEGDAWLMQDRAVLSGQCFFDVLHAMAIKAKHQLSLGKLEVHDDDVLTKLGCENVKTMMDAAAEAGQPFDINTMPLPAIGGQIVGGGLYDSGAVAIALRSTGRAVVPVASIGNMSGEIFGDLVPVASNAAGPSQLPALYNKARASKWAVQSEKFCDRLRNVSLCERGFGIEGDWEYHIMTNLFGTMAGAVGGMFSVMITAGLSGGPTVATGAFAVVTAAPATAYQLVRRPTVRMAFTRAQMAMHAMRLPAGEAKTLVQAFNRMAKGVYQMERAADYADSYKHDTRHVSYYKKALRYIGRAAKTLDLPPEQVQALYEALDAGRFPEMGSFWRKLEAERNNTVKKLTAKADTSEFSI